jgi:ADP-L-glycero-D-manno-heptose 6-epimerase
MLIVTGGAGFIGSNLIHELNAQGITDILVVDNLANAKKFRNLDGARYVDYMDKRELRRVIGEDALGAGKIEAILHQGACSSTLEDDGVYMMDNNFQYTKEVLDFAVRVGAPLVFASSTAVYGLSGSGHFTPAIENERRSTSTAIPNSSLTITSATSWRWTGCRLPPWAFAISTSTAPGSNTRDAWPRSSITSPNR